MKTSAVVIKKYGNRRLYDTAESRYVNLDDLAAMVRAGKDVRVVDAKTGRILGCAVLGIEGGELMAALQVAMMGGLPYTALRDGVFAHPTLAESLNNLFATL